MIKLTPKQTRECSTETLKMIYYVIIGLAFARALTVCSEGASWIPWVLLFALLPTICRFVHGASIHLRIDIDSEERWKLPLDFIGFFLQASFFYLMANLLNNPILFLIYFMIMLFFDAVWLIGSSMIKYIKWEETTKQWLWSDFILIVILLVTLIWLRNFIPIIIPIGAIIATIWDYFSKPNRDFYFGTTKSTTPAN